MAQTRIDYGQDKTIKLTSSFVVDEKVTGERYVQSRTTDTTSITLEYDLPNGSEIKRAQVYATWSYPSYGFYYRAINGINTSGEAVDIEIDPSATSIQIGFTFTARGHTDAVGTYSDSTRISDIYLLIEYTCGVYLYHAENGALVPYQLYHAENGELVPYQLFKAVDGTLIQY